MNLLKKAAISLAATSMIAAPVAASAAPAARAASAVDGQSELEGSTSWIIAVLALVAVVGGIIIASDNDSDEPTSPRSEEHTSELQSLMRISYAVFCLKKKQITSKNTYKQYQK